MEVSAQAVANVFLQLAKQEHRQLTNMQLQKLVFLSQGYGLALLGAPIYYHNTHAWQWGPVVPKLYKQLQKFGSGEVTEELRVPPDDAGVLSQEQLGVLHGVWNAYKRYSGAQLSAITHKQGSPWSKAWSSNKFGVIPLDDIKCYYADLIASGRQ